MHLYSPWRRAGGALFLIVFGGVFLYFLVPEVVANFASARWTQRSCTILSSAADRERQITHDTTANEMLYRTSVRYSYQVGTRRFESTRYRFIDPFTDNRAAVESAAATYSAGAVVPCYVDPDDPTQAVLDRRLSPFMLIALLPGAIAGLGLLTLANVGIEAVKQLR
jgi:hypothetical protein